MTFYLQRKRRVMRFLCCCSQNNKNLKLCLILRLNRLRSLECDRMKKHLFFYLELLAVAWPKPVFGVKVIKSETKR